VGSWARLATRRLIAPGQMRDLYIGQWHQLREQDLVHQGDQLRDAQAAPMISSCRNARFLQRIADRVRTDKTSGLSQNAPSTSKPVTPRSAFALSW
jgi:hypothetical protein